MRTLALAVVLGLAVAGTMLVPAASAIPSLEEICDATIQVCRPGSLPDNCYIRNFVPPSIPCYG